MLELMKRRTHHSTEGPFKAYGLFETFKQVASFFLIFSTQLNKNKASGLQGKPVSAGTNVNVTANNSVKINTAYPVSGALQLNYFHADRLHLIRDLRCRSKKAVDIKVVDSLAHHKLCSCSYKQNLEQVECACTE